MSMRLMAFGYQGGVLAGRWEASYLDGKTRIFGGKALSMILGDCAASVWKTNAEKLSGLCIPQVP